MSDLELCCGERLHSAQIQCPATGLRWLPLELIDGTVSLPKHPDHIPMLEVRVRCASVRGGACALARACVRTCAWAWLRALAQERVKNLCVRRACACVATGSAWPGHSPRECDALARTDKPRTDTGTRGRAHAVEYAHTYSKAHARTHPHPYSHIRASPPRVHTVGRMLTCTARYRAAGPAPTAKATPGSSSRASDDGMPGV